MSYSFIFDDQIALFKPTKLPVTQFKGLRQLYARNFCLHTPRNWKNPPDLLECGAEIPRGIIENCILTSGVLADSGRVVGQKLNSPTISQC